MFGKIKAYVISYLRDLKEEWIHLDRAMQYWMYFTAVVLLGFLVFAAVNMINYAQDKKELLNNHEYCYAYVFKYYYVGKANPHIRIQYNVEGVCYDDGVYPKAHVGDSILIMYNPNKPSFCLPVEYNKNKYVTKQMVDFHMYHIDKRKIH